MNTGLFENELPEESALLFTVCSSSSYPPSSRARLYVINMAVCEKEHLGWEVWIRIVRDDVVELTCLFRVFLDSREDQFCLSFSEAECD